MAKQSKRAEIGEKVAIGVAAGVATKLTLGAIGSVATGNPAPFLAALHIAAAAGSAGAAASGGNN
ncbi:MULTISPECIES: hypothetical protein [unclassified Roseofilum]|uniref:hypothetical protein n=1 Tax=unclassified Roseofilum TaxID=2620099 RepID=UPI000E8CB0E3|nr:MULTISPECIES: hypothetical protein [unclassified Roseofilum]HBQ99257.1 hypothetical protein [Cyanobacteria bacterium UBA11691]MBP0009180.1 hypothetical protein [Roseofilum sp. Belize Diploria]MBP0014634.1 hypothetical protein [Roseofilum sp. SID3]MBP0026013.1 hypothetical protein [Roseofilum sp. SID2]MBP0038330.1 hypothetical protein [Roseofilum sp. SID1]